MTRVRIVVAAALAVTIAAGVGANHLAESWPPSYNQRIEGAVGEDIEIYPLTVHVSDVVATEIAQIPGWDGATSLDSDGIWVAVTLTWTTMDETRSLPATSTRLVDDHGRSYTPSNRVAAIMPLAGPGIWISGQLWFEVPHDVLDSVGLMIAPGVASMGALPFTDTVIALNLTREDVRATYALAHGGVVPPDHR